MYGVHEPAQQNAFRFEHSERFPPYRLHIRDEDVRDWVNDQVEPAVGGVFPTFVPNEI
jgi:hypothetical protein